MITLLIFILNTTLISTLMCLNDRLIHQVPLWRQRSFCFHCGHILAWFDLMPVLSAVMTQSRCRYCQHTYGWRYGFLELLGGLIGTWLFVSPQLWITALLLFFLALEDWTRQTIHANLLLPWLLYLVWTHWFEPQLLIAGGLGLVCLFLIYCRHTMGSGDLPVLLTLACVSSATALPLTLLLSTLLTYTYLKLRMVRIAPYVPFLLVSWLLSLCIEKAITWLI